MSKHIPPIVICSCTCAGSVINKNNILFDQGHCCRNCFLTCYITETAKMVLIYQVIEQYSELVWSENSFQCLIQSFSSLRRSYTPIATTTTPASTVPIKMFFISLYTFILLELSANRGCLSSYMFRSSFFFNLIRLKKNNKDLNELGDKTILLIMRFFLFYLDTFWKHVFFSNENIL